MHGLSKEVEQVVIVVIVGVSYQVWDATTLHYNRRVNKVLYESIRGQIRGVLGRSK